MLLHFNNFNFCISFQLNNNVHDHHTRQLFHVPSVDTSTYGIRSIKFHCPELWNNTWKNGIAIDKCQLNNISFDQIHNIHQFKRALKKHFLYNYSTID